MAERNRRGGCGCVSLVLLFLLVGSVLSALGALTGDLAPEAAVAGVVGLAALTGLVIVLVLWNRRNRGEDTAQTSAAAASPRPDRSPSSGRERSDREVRSGARHLSTEPESDEALVLKQRLTQAVSDLADNVEEMPGRTDPRPDRRLTSEEMIARAKRRIREKADDPDL